MQMRCGAVLVATAVVAVVVATPARADEPVPQADAPCPAGFGDVMTQLPGGADYLICQAGPDVAGSWAPVVSPFPPSSRWLSYGPEMVLHGQGFRNPNLRSGPWTATPLDPGSTCSARQVAVVSAGILAPPQDSQGEPGQPLAFEVVPKLFTVTLAGDCLWTEDQPPIGW